jgi:hypothetical protein
MRDTLSTFLCSSSSLSLFTHFLLILSSLHYPYVSSFLFHYIHLTQCRVVHRTQPKFGGNILLYASYWFLVWRTLQPWRWRLHVPTKRRLTFYIWEDITLHNHLCANVNSYNLLSSSFISPSLSSHSIVLFPFRPKPSSSCGHLRVPKC